MLCNLRDLISQEKERGFGTAAFTVYGYADAGAVIRAAEEKNRGVVLMVNRAAILHTPLEILGSMLVYMARQAPAPVCVHLDHARDFPVIERAIAAGFTSVMYDGSHLELLENIERTREIAEFAHRNGVSVEGEVGVVGSETETARHTQPEEAAVFAEETGVDALAVAVGTRHRMQRQEAVIDFETLRRIKQAAEVPLVIHGASGVRDADVREMMQCGACKINIGTALKKAFACRFKGQIKALGDEIDFAQLLALCIDAVKEEACSKMDLITLPES